MVFLDAPALARRAWSGRVGIGVIRVLRDWLDGLKRAGKSPPGGVFVGSFYENACSETEAGTLFSRMSLISRARS